MLISPVQLTTVLGLHPAMQRYQEMLLVTVGSHGVMAASRLVEQAQDRWIANHPCRLLDMTAVRAPTLGADEGIAEDEQNIVPCHVASLTRSEEQVIAPAYAIFYFIFCVSATTTAVPDVIVASGSEHRYS